jgi:hypothetical protein
LITYESIWLFERSTPDEDFFQSRIRWAPYTSEQVEAVCFADDDTLVLADEVLGELFAVRMDDLTPIR